MSLVTLLTDFGQRDPYVGTMKGIMLAHNEHLRLVDLSHEIPRHDVQAASFWLGKVHRYFPTGTIHLAVIDPGVGTAREALAVGACGQFFVAPDNGLLSDVLLRAAETESAVVAVSLDSTRFHDVPTAVGATFHGRDLFAPAAAELASGRDLLSLGAALEPRGLIRWDVRPKVHHARVRVVDHFGNLITDAPSHRMKDSVVEFQGHALPWVHTYGEAPRGKLVALPGSWGTIEIAINGGSAAELTHAQTGTRFPLRPAADTLP